MRRHRAVPIHYAPAQQRLLLGFVYHVDTALVAAAEQLTGCRVEACFVSPSRYREQLARLTAGLQPGLPPLVSEGAKEVHIAGLTASRCARAHVTDVLTRHAVQNGATHMRLAITRTVAWARLRGGREDVDLIVELSPPRKEGMTSVASDLLRDRPPYGPETEGVSFMSRASRVAQSILKRKGERP
jgi:hypothetical protein